MNVESFYRASARTSTVRPAFLAQLQRRRWFLLLVVVPTVLASVYWGLIASDVYVSQSRFVIKAPGQKSLPSTTLANLIQTTGMVGGDQQTRAVLTSIRSPNTPIDLHI